MCTPFGPAYIKRFHVRTTASLMLLVDGPAVPGRIAPPAAVSKLAYGGSISAAFGLTWRRGASAQWPPKGLGSSVIPCAIRTPGLAPGSPCNRLLASCMAAAPQANTSYWAGSIGTLQAFSAARGMVVGGCPDFYGASAVSSVRSHSLRISRANRSCCSRC